MLKTKEQVPCFSVILCCARGDAQMGEAEGSAGLGLNLGQTGSPDGTPLARLFGSSPVGGGQAALTSALCSCPHAPTPPRPHEGLHCSLTHLSPALPSAPVLLLVSGLPWRPRSVTVLWPTDCPSFELPSFLLDKHSWQPVTSECSNPCQPSNLL